jgi:hypothetical protein
MSVTIGVNTYDTYGDAAGLGVYAGGSFAFFATYTAASVDNRARALVEATRIIERQLWAGAKVSDGQALQWPRTGVTYADGSEVSSASIPDEVVEAAYELALAGLADVSLFTGTSTEKQTKKLEAKGTSIEYFSPRAGDRWPGRVAELLAQFLASTASSGTPSGDSYVSDGVDCGSRFDDCDAYHVNGGG